MRLRFWAFLKKNKVHDEKCGFLQFSTTRVNVSYKTSMFWSMFMLRDHWWKPLTPKHRETHGCVVSTVATDALVPKQQALSIRNVD